MKRSAMIILLLILGLGLCVNLSANQKVSQDGVIASPKPFTLSAPAEVNQFVARDLNPPQNLHAQAFGHNVQLNWAAPAGSGEPGEGFNDDFESYPDFSLTFDPWVLVDVDQSTTYGMTGTTWANAYAAMAYIIFNPTATVPPITSFTAHSGNKMAASFASTASANNDWMISPLVTIGGGESLSFWARSFTTQYGMERFKVGVSTGGTAPANFTIISGTSYIQAPDTWTQYSYDLSAYAGQDIRIGIQCVSDDAFIFLVDDVNIGGYTTTRDLTGYKVYRDGAMINTIVGTDQREFLDLDLALGTYSYSVTATYTDGESAPAGPVSVSIQDHAAPLDLAATVEGNDVTLNWTSPEPPLTGDWITWCNPDVIGNSIGTGSAAQFDVAHMFDATDLASHQGATLAQIKFVPAFASCVYTVKVWTGGNATTPGTMVYSAVHDGAVVGDWNLHILNTPVPIPADRLWIGYGVNTQGGHPAGCDDGPVLEGKGNIMNFNGWTTLTALAPTLTYNWSIQGFVADGTTAKNIVLKPITEDSNPVQTGTLAAARFEPNRNNRALLGYKVYRDGAQIAQIGDPSITTYTDMDLNNAEYLYGVSAMYSDGESEPATILVNVDFQLAPIVFSDSFEQYENFVTAIAPWTLLDQDTSETYGFQGIEFPNSGSAMAYIVFNPTATVPPIDNLTAYDGSKMMGSFAAVNGPNSDWLITPRIQLGTASALKFYARSHTTQYGMERFRVGVSTLATIIPQGFQYVSGPDYVEVPGNWTEYIYDLSNYNNQNVYIAIRCVSDDAFIFFVDQVSVHSNAESNEDLNAPVVANELKGNYPNPFNPETTISFSMVNAGPISIDIYNQKGQLVKNLVNDNMTAGNHTAIWNGTDNHGQSVSSGVYYYKMNAGKYSSTKKMIMMK